MASPASALAGTSTSSRFVSEKTLTEAQERRKEEWKAAYERLGQAPPEQTEPEKYDPRSLAEKLQEQRNLKQSAFDEKYSIRNQFRSLEADEVSFLDSILDEKKAEERARQREIDQELQQFRAAVSERQILPDDPVAALDQAGTSGSPPPLAGKAASPPIAASSQSLPPPAKKKKTQKGLLAGAIKRKSSGGEEKKKAFPVPVKTASTGLPDTVEQGAQTEESKGAKPSEFAEAQVQEGSAAKKQKLDP